MVRILFTGIGEIDREGKMTTTGYKKQMAATAEATEKVTSTTTKVTMRLEQHLYHPPLKCFYLSALLTTKRERERLHQVGRRSISQKIT